VPFSFDRASLAGARAAAAPRDARPPVIPSALPPRTPGDVTLA
jgi:exodeoxyribonuclease V gamma subunit